jgi:hypothetical protein
LFWIDFERISDLVVRPLFAGHSIDFEHVLLLNEVSRVALVLDEPTVRKPLIDLSSSLSHALLSDCHVGVLTLEAEIKLFYGIVRN